MSIYQVWIPGEKGYKEHLDRLTFSNDEIAVIKEQTNQLKNSLHQQTSELSSQTKKIIATNEQLILSVNEGFNRIAEINERGFRQVTSAIESMHSDMNYLLGVIIQRLEYQIALLKEILTTLQEPFETMVKEYYRKGCLFIQQGFLQGAIDCFKESISLKMGEYFFPSHYQLGRIYLSGIEGSKNLVNTKTANEYLLKANEFGNRILKTDPSFKPVLADCKFLLSQSYYYQLSGLSNTSELEFVNNAIKFCEEAVVLNPNLSQGYYHLTKYYAYRIGKEPSHRTDDEIEKMLIYFFKAVEIDRNYLRTIIPDDIIFYDRVLEPVKEDILKLIIRLTDIKKKNAESQLKIAHNYIQLLDKKNTSHLSKYASEYNQLKDIVLSSENNFNTRTYFGYDDCIKILGEL